MAEMDQTLHETLTGIDFLWVSHWKHLLYVLLVSDGSESLWCASFTLS
jgi:hypothetical protein